MTTQKLTIEYTNCTLVNYVSKYHWILQRKLTEYSRLAYVGLINPAV